MQISVPHPRRTPTNHEVEHCLTTVRNLDEQIAQIKENIEHLQKQLKDVEDTRMNHLSFMSAIRCLPPELIGQICKACIKMGTSPLVLNQVCGRFREIVNNTSEFWGCVYVTDGWTDSWQGYRYWDNVKVSLYHYCFKWII
jgi:hypothetical protein